jgi:hypothetical protein
LERKGAVWENSMWQVERPWRKTMGAWDGSLPLGSGEGNRRV